jgi:glycine hydroxymethyltransferase
LESKVFEIIEKEKHRQETTCELIASENFVSENVMRAVGSCLTNKYSEGYPAMRTSGNKGRYYGGCQYVDELEEYCCDKWREAFNTDYHVNVQPHSGSQANMAAYFSVLKPGDTILAMSLDNGGHLTHGSGVNFSGKLFNTVFYNVYRKTTSSSYGDISYNSRAGHARIYARGDHVSPSNRQRSMKRESSDFNHGECQNVDADGFIDYDDIDRKIKECNPALVLAGASAYSRIIDFERIYNIIKANSTDEYKPYFMVDMAHIAGLIVAGDHPSPFGLADIITTTTHKTLRGPRGGMIFCRPELAKKVDSAVFPCCQGGALQHVIAGKAVAAEEACTDEYKEYIHRVVRNCKAMCDEFIRLGYKVVTGGTDNHLFLLDLTETGLTGKEVQDELDLHGITLNKNCIPNETRSPMQTSGVRIGTAAMTTKGYDACDFVAVARKIDYVIKDMARKKMEDVYEIHR